MRHRILIVEHINELMDDLFKCVKGVFPDSIINRAEDEIHALKLIKNNDYNIVITDLMLMHEKPDELQGLKIAEKAKEKSTSTAVIAVTSQISRFLSSKEITKYSDLGLIPLDRNMKGPGQFFKLLQYQLRLYSARAQGNLFQIKHLWNVAINLEKYSYWLFLMNGIDMENDRKILAEMLIWESILSNSESAFCPCQPQDEFFFPICNFFELSELPSLIVSNNNNMEPSIIIKEKALLKLTNQDNGLRKFLNKIQIQLKNQDSIEEIRRDIRRQEYWDWFLWGKNEFGEFLKFII